MGDHSVFLLQQFGQKPKPLKDQGEHLQLQALVLILLWQVLTSLRILRAESGCRLWKSCMPDFHPGNLMIHFRYMNAKMLAMLDKNLNRT
jgi:hypothetical protein